MKELTIEEKARRYDEAIETAIKINSGEGVAAPSDWTICEVIFPELKESKNEKIRKVIYGWIYTQPSQFFDSDFSKEEMLAWLEKQGKQKQKDKYTFNAIPRLLEMIKPTNSSKSYCQKLIDSLLQEGYTTDAKIVSDCLKQMNGEKVAMATMDEQKLDDKVEPKFKVGDWVVSPTGVCWHIDRIENNRYEVTSDTGKCADWPLDTDLYHLWTIQDAKDGDILCTYECCKPKIVFILKGTPKKHYALSYHCYYNIMYPHFASDSEKGCLAPNDEDVKPATKEQRDLLFKKMHEAGYEWDAEKKELGKIEQESTWNEKVKGLNEIETYILSLVPDRPLDAIKVDAKNIRYIINKKQTPTWSEEDETMITNIIIMLKEGASLHFNKKDISKGVDWLKSLKDRIQPKQEWNEEDKEVINLLLELVYEQDKMSPQIPSNEKRKRMLYWLKSLRPQNKWKPSKEQINTLQDAIVYVEGYNSNFKGSGSVLEKLYRDLNKLKG